LDQRRNWPTIIVVLDEASFALKNNTRTVVYQGQKLTASDMVAMLLKGAASGDVHVILASQRSTNDNFGDAGGDVTTNIGWSAAFMSKDEAEVGRLMGDYSLPMPRHRGQFWLDDGMGELPQQSKAPYIQSVDPTKPQLSDGLTIADVSLSRASLPRIGRALDAGSARAAGSDYGRRHTRMTQAMQNYLRGVDEDEVAAEASHHQADDIAGDFAEEIAMPAVVNGDVVPPRTGEPAGPNPQVTPTDGETDEESGSETVSDGAVVTGGGAGTSGVAAAAFEATMAQIAALRAGSGTAPAGGPAGGAAADAPHPGAVAVLDRPTPEFEVSTSREPVSRGEQLTWPERVLAVLAREGRMPRAEIINQFGQQYAQVVQNTLTKLFNDRKVERESGEYWLPNGDSE
jgi:hypothetical protein